MASPSQTPLALSSLEEGLGEEILEYLYANATRNDIIKLINRYNYSRPEAEHIFIFPAQEDIKSTNYCASEQNKALAAKLLNERALSLLHKLNDDTEAPLNSQCRSRSPSLSRGDDTPAWLGVEGFEKFTTEWLAQQAEERYRMVNTLPPHAKEPRTGDELASYIGRTIDNSKTYLLDLLSDSAKEMQQYADEIKQGKVEIADEVKLVVDGIVAFAKGKGPEIINNKPLSFTGMVEYQNSLFRTIRNREEALVYWWWCYFNQCSVTSTNVDENVVAVAKSIVALMSDATQEEITEDYITREAADEDVVSGIIAEEMSVEKQQLLGHETLKQVISEEDQRYPRYFQETLQEASRRSGVEVAKILAQVNEAKMVKVEPEFESANASE